MACAGDDPLHRPPKPGAPSPTAASGGTDRLRVLRSTSSSRQRCALSQACPESPPTHSYLQALLRSSPACTWAAAPSGHGDRRRRPRDSAGRRGLAVASGHARPANRQRAGRPRAATRWTHPGHQRAQGLLGDLGRNAAQVEHRQQPIEAGRPPCPFWRDAEVNRFLLPDGTAVARSLTFCRCTGSGGSRSEWSTLGRALVDDAMRPSQALLRDLRDPRPSAPLPASGVRRPEPSP